MEEAKKSLKQKNIKIASNFLIIANKIGHTYIYLVLFHSIIKSAIPLFNIIIFKNIVDEIAQYIVSNKLKLYISLFVIVNLILGILMESLNYWCKIHAEKFMTKFEVYVGNHIMNMRYEYLEKHEILDMKETALHTIYNQKVIPTIVNSMANIFAAAISMLTLVSIVANFDWYIVIIIIAISILNAFFFQKFLEQDFKIAKETVPLNRVFMYFYKLTMNFKVAKDIRLFKMFPLFERKICDHHENFSKVFDPLWIRKGQLRTEININSSLQMFVGYLYAVYKVVNGSISIGDFTMINASIIKFSDSLYELLTNVSTFLQSCKYMELFTCFMDLPEEDVEVHKSIAKEDVIRVEFNHVYFSYPDQTNDVLHDVSFVLEKGDKLSIVGENGAGKSTIVKLICRLYRPVKGEILFNGININEYPMEDYTKMISTVFQDFKLFAFTVEENIFFEKTCEDQNRIIEIFQKVGIWDEIQKNEKLLKTPMYKIFDADGIELSGGQEQKMAIARAMYKESGIRIFDEPASSLDPIAEADIYNVINKLTNDGITIFISHRMSSGKFCNKIMVLEQGTIVESGSHHELLSNINGKYYKMWNAQAKYYV